MGLLDGFGSVRGSFTSPTTAAPAKMAPANLGGGLTGLGVPTSQSFILPANAMTGTQDQTHLAVAAGIPQQNGQFGIYGPDNSSSYDIPIPVSTGLAAGAPLRSAPLAGSAPSLSSAPTPVPATGLAAGAPKTSYGFSGGELTGPDADRAIAEAQAADVQARQKQVYDYANGLTNQVTPDMIQGLQQNALNSPYLSANGQDAGAMAAQNGGGHFGGYGYAAHDALQQSAAVQANQNANDLRATIGQQQNAFNTGKASLLQSINDSDPTFADYDNLYTQGTNFATQQQEIANSLAQQQNQNYAQGTSGVLGFLGSLQSNPVVQGFETAGLSALGVPLPISAGVAGLAGGAPKTATSQPTATPDRTLQSLDDPIPAARGLAAGAPRANGTNFTSGYRGMS